MIFRRKAEPAEPVVINLHFDLDHAIPDELKQEDDGPEYWWSDFFHIAEPGWRAVYHECENCTTPDLQIPIEMWVMCNYKDGSSSVTGLINTINGLIPATFHHAFVAYAKPGRTMENVLSGEVLDYQ